MKLGGILSKSDAIDRLENTELFKVGQGQGQKAFANVKARVMVFFQDRGTIPLAGEKNPCCGASRAAANDDNVECVLFWFHAPFRDLLPVQIRLSPILHESAFSCLPSPDGRLERLALIKGYRPSRLIKGSVLLHALAMLGLWFSPNQLWAFLAVLGLNHTALTLAGLWPRCALLGPNWRRVENAPEKTLYLTFDDGPDPKITPQILGLLAQSGMKATFFLIGDRVREHPNLARRIVQEGHGIGNHSSFHSLGFAFQGMGGLRRDLEAAQLVIEEATGVCPRFFRAPFGIRSPLLEPVLFALGLELVSWTRRGYDTREVDPELVLARLSKPLETGSILLLHDGKTPGAHPQATGALGVLPALLATIRDGGFTSQVLPDFSRVPAQQDANTSE